MIFFIYGAITRSGRAFQLASTSKLLYVYLYLTLLEVITNILQPLINVWTQILQLPTNKLAENAV